MNLKKFINETINNIDGAVKENPSILGVRGVVHFDVAVIANESAEAGGGIQVIGIGKAGARINNAQQTTTRLQFDIQTKGAISPSQSKPYNPTKNS